MMHPLSIFIAGLELSLIAIDCAGIAFRLYVASPDEPIAGRFAEHPWGTAENAFPFTQRGKNWQCQLLRIRQSVLIGRACVCTNPSMSAKVVAGCSR